jgi:hypothetical protein
MINSHSDSIGKIFLTPSHLFFLYKENPVDCININNFPSSYISTKPIFQQQFVVVIKTEFFVGKGDVYYQVLFKDGITMWVHYFDLITIDQKTGIPVISKFEDEI